MIVQIRVFQDEDGRWCASGIDHGFHTQGHGLDELFASIEEIEEATQLHFEEELLRGKTNERGEWNETIADHREVSRGTLRSVLRRLSAATDLPVDELVKRLRSL